MPLNVKNVKDLIEISHMKHEWRKKEKDVYFPKTQAEVINVPPFKFLTLSGEGNPNSAGFSDYISALYSLSYAIKMNLKKLAVVPDGYVDYTVYPLEGVWGISETAKKNFTGVINKDDLVFDLMIRQPSFVSDMFFREMLDFTKKKKPQHLLNEVEFKEIAEGKCIQMMHIGPYDDEPESFHKMELFAGSQNLTRKSKVHREIYLSDFRKVAPEKLKTVLRFQLKV